MNVANEKKMIPLQPIWKDNQKVNAEKKKIKKGREWLALAYSLGRYEPGAKGMEETKSPTSTPLDNRYILSSHFLVSPQGQLQSNYSYN